MGQLENASTNIRLNKLKFALNHITAPGLHWSDFLDLAASLDCIGVEFRNDLSTPLFSGDRPDRVHTAAIESGLRILGLSQVYPFNDWSEVIRSRVKALIAQATSCGAETISLIPSNDGTDGSTAKARETLRVALREIRPLLADSGLVALVEPLGFERSSLRFKAETIEAIDVVGGRNEFRIVHDTFHHFLAGESEVFPEWTGIVHISGVVDQGLSSAEMEDEHRGLVTAFDRIENVAQINELLAAGYDGPFSFEAFSPIVHAIGDPASELSDSIQFLKSQRMT